MYKSTDALRENLRNYVEDEYRTPFRRDYGRLIHSPAFRRLQGKTQLYPGMESDFFRNRLTHSMEVAQIAKTIATFINKKFLADLPNLHINEDICEFAGLAHDLGHPPFGHQGEEALDDCMRDFGGFEGNAQTLRILGKIEKKSRLPEIKKNEEYRFGLNLTYRSLASILKYDNPIPLKQKDRLKKDKHKAIKGFYQSEQELVTRIKKNVVSKEYKKQFKTIECKIMDLADDIAYSTYDLEDGFKAGFYHPTNFFFYPEPVFENVAAKVSKAMEDKVSIQDIKDVLFEIFDSIYSFDDQQDFVETTDEEGEEYWAVKKEKAKAVFSTIVNVTTSASKKIAEEGYRRNKFTSELVSSAISGIEFKLDEKNPCLSNVSLKPGIKLRVEVLKNFTYESQILSPRLKVAEYRGKEIVKTIFKAISENEGWRLMPADFQSLYHHFKNTEDKYRCISDFVSGMTDKYAIEFYGRLKSENPETIFKPF